ncbi:MAG: hypothetical protein Q9160_004798 [Pyrenula sp. 1 TL-2023]
MSQQYASSQPQGFKNRIENVAIVGVGGHVGKYLVEALLKTGKHTVTVLTRVESTSVVPAGVIVKKVNYDDPASLTSALNGIDFFIITMAVTAPQDQQAKLLEAAAATKVPWIMPNEFGIDHEVESLGKDTMLGEPLSNNRKHIEKLGMDWVGLTCGFWYEYSLSMAPMLYGFDIKNQALTFYDDGNTHINTSTLPLCGLAVAKLLSLKVLKDDANDTSPCLSDFTRQTVYISSFNVCQRDMFESVKRVTGTSDADWKISSEPSAERYKAGLEEMKTPEGARMGFAKILYSRVFFLGDDGNFEKRRGLHNGVLGLPSEDMDEFTRKSIEWFETDPVFGSQK